MVEEQVIETLAIDIKLDKNFKIQDLKDLASALKSLQGASKTLSAKNGIKDSTLAISNLSKINFAATLSSLTRFYHIAVKAGKTVQNIAQGGMDYNETLNLWTVAMRGHNEEATKFLNTMNKAYGVSEQTLMNAQATFKNMIGSLGQISSEMAYNLSEGITQMAFDYASLYNVSIDAAITKFQAALAGQVRPIRTGTGLDITENTLFQFYQEIGGEKTVRQLNRTEKQLLAILAVYEQMEASGAIGDMAKTINYAANQSRVMAETWSDIKDYAGLIIVDFLEANKILVYINAGLMFAADVLKAFAEGMGAIRTEITDTSWGDGLNEIAGGAEGANEEVEKLKNTLFGFDKFNVLGEATSNEDLDISHSIIDAFAKYEGISKNLKMEAREIADEWLETFGFTKDINGELVISAEQMSNMLSYAKEISAVILGIGVSLIALKSFGVGWVGLIAAGVAYLYVTNEQLADSINGLLLSLLPLVNLLGLVFQLINPIADILAPIVDFLAAIVDLCVLILIPVSFVVEAFVKILDTVIAIGKALFTWDWGEFSNRMGTWSNWSSMSMVDTWTYGQNVKSGKIAPQNMAFTTSSQLESSIARGTAVGMSAMSDGTSPIDIDVSIDGQNLFQIFRGVAQRNGYDVVKVR